MTKAVEIVDSVGRQRASLREQRGLPAAGTSFARDEEGKLVPVLDSNGELRIFVCLAAATDAAAVVFVACIAPPRDLNGHA